MYYPFFLTYILTGLFIAIVVFVWALKNNQFSEQQRARFLPLENGAPALSEGPHRGRLKILCIFFLALVIIASSFALVAYALFFQ